MRDATIAVKRQPAAGVLVTPPADVLFDVFPPRVRDAWRAKPAEQLIRRLNILCACGPYPSDPLAANELGYFRAQKAAWEAYVYTAFACGFFEGERGLDLRGRFASRKEEDFQSAMAECMSCWFLAGRCQLPLQATAPGRNGSNLDMSVTINSAQVGIEVKAPYREPPETQVWSGDDSDKISQAMGTANKQLTDECPNLLVLVPRLRRTMYSHRRDLLKAAFGQSKITWEINIQSGEPGPTEVTFFPDGRFLNTTRPGGQPLKPDGLPAYRRISAVVCIEETIKERYPFPDPRLLVDEMLWQRWEKARGLHLSLENRAWIEHEVLVMHNPYAYHAISHELFCEFPQLVPVGPKMQWTDGEEVIV